VTEAICFPQTSIGILLSTNVQRLTGKYLEPLLQKGPADEIHSERNGVLLRKRAMRVSGTQVSSRKDEAALIARIRAGEESAMADVYDRHSGIVYAVALRVLANTSAAEDVVQEVFLQLWRNPQSFDADRGRLAPWLAVIARNRAIDLLRKRPMEDDIEELPISTGVNLEDEAAGRMAISKVRGVLAELPQDQRRLLEMAFFEGMTHSEIARQTGEPLGTVKTRIRSGLLALRKAFS
jgi:RNA polymerase sigma-70 factor (ECF subfamily)